MCVSRYESKADFSLLTLEGCLRSGWQQMLMFVLACSVGVCAACDTEVCFQSAALQRYWCGGWCWLRCIVRGPWGLLGERAAQWLQALSITITPSIGEGPGQREREATEKERKGDKATAAEREGHGVYLHLSDGFTVEWFFGLGGGWWLRRRQLHCLCWKASLHRGLCPGRMANDVICRASAPNLTSTSLHDGNQYWGL